MSSAYNPPLPFLTYLPTMTSQGFTSRGTIALSHQVTTLTISSNFKEFHPSTSCLMMVKKKEVQEEDGRGERVNDPIPLTIELSTIQRMLKLSKQLT